VAESSTSLTSAHLHSPSSQLLVLSDSLAYIQVCRHSFFIFHYNGLQNFCSVNLYRSRRPILRYLRKRRIYTRFDCQRRFLRGTIIYWIFSRQARTSFSLSLQAVLTAKWQIRASEHNGSFDNRNRSNDLWSVHPSHLRRSSVCLTPLILPCSMATRPHLPRYHPNSRTLWHVKWGLCQPSCRTVTVPRKTKRSG